ncbi:MAG: hypothetical protein LBT54_03710, partial [Bifidobacteriaceae bacterium]|nr:hypothetical protein [Bifidobacteriaceae bacterium]
MAMPRGVCLVEIALPEGRYGGLRAVFRDSKGRWWQYDKTGWSRPKALNRAGGARAAQVAAPWLVRRDDGAVEINGAQVPPPAPGAAAVWVDVEKASPYYEGAYEGPGELRLASILWTGGVLQVLDAKSWWPGGRRVSALVALPAGRSYAAVAQSGPWVGVLDGAGGAWLARCDQAEGAVSCGSVAAAPAPPAGVRYAEIAGYTDRLVLRRSDGELWNMANARMPYGRDKGIWEGAAYGEEDLGRRAARLGSGQAPSRITARGMVEAIGSYSAGEF